MTQPGWYQDPSGQPMLRYFDGHVWTGSTSAYAPPPASTDTNQIRTLVNVVVWAALVIGVVLSVFTSVSLLTGTGKVWTGVAIAGAGMVAALLLRYIKVWVKVVAVLLVVACVSSAIYDEVQLQHKRDQINSILGG